MRYLECMLSRPHFDLPLHTFSMLSDHTQEAVSARG